MMHLLRDLERRIERLEEDNNDAITKGFQALIENWAKMLEKAIAENVTPDWATIHRTIDVMKEFARAEVK